MEKLLETLMAQYGMALVLTRDGGQREVVKCFFRPVRATSWQSMVPQATPLGTVSQGQYLYLGPVTAEIRAGDTLHLEGKEYVFQRVETYYWGSEPLYRWGLCVEEGGGEAWGS